MLSPNENFLPIPFQVKCLDTHKFRDYVEVLGEFLQDEHIYVISDRPRQIGIQGFDFFILVPVLSPF